MPAMLTFSPMQKMEVMPSTEGPGSKCGAQMSLPSTSRSGPARLRAAQWILLPSQKTDRTGDSSWAKRNPQLDQLGWIDWWLNYDWWLMIPWRLGLMIDSAGRFFRPGAQISSNDLETANPLRERVGCCRWSWCTSPETVRPEPAGRTNLCTLVMLKGFDSLKWWRFMNGLKDQNGNTPLLPTPWNPDVSNVEDGQVFGWNCPSITIKLQGIPSANSKQLVENHNF